MSKYKYSLALLDSARAFLESGVQHACSAKSNGWKFEAKIGRMQPTDAWATKSGEWKFALLHTVIALELLAKARIAFEDPHRIVRGKVDDLHFEQGEFQSINIDEAFRRAGFRLTGRPLAAFTALKAARNRLVHFRETSSPEETKALVAAGLHLFFDLHETHFSDEQAPRGAKCMVELAQDLSTFRDFVACRMEDLASRLQSADRPRTRHLSECQRCLQEADVIVDESVVCLFCGYRQSIQDCAAWLSKDCSVELCPVCNRPAVAKNRYTKNEEPTYECFCCGYFRGPEPPGWNDEGKPMSRLRSVADVRERQPSVVRERIP
jgi:hypothetical protein